MKNVKYLYLFLILFVTGIACPNLSGQDPSEALISAVMQGDSDAVVKALEGGADMETRDGEDKTPLMNAVHNKKPDLVRLLIQRGAEVNAREENGWSPLMFAAMGGDSDMVKILLEAGADAGIQTNDGETPLQRAEKIQAAGLGDYSEIITLLKETEEQ